jgi:alpha-beta hydrolase superfamily lysophospholipase
VATYKDYRIKSLKVKMYEDARHELLNELNKDAVMEDLLDWVEEKL